MSSSPSLLIPSMDLSKKQTKEERINQRVARINQRKAQLQAATSRSTTSTSPRSSRLNPSSPRSSSTLLFNQQQPSPSHLALQSSYATLSASITSSLSSLQSHQRRRQLQQQQQRSEHDQQAEARQRSIDEERTTSAATNERLHARLAELASSPSYSTPQQLYLDITATYREALAVVGRKDEIIRDLSVAQQSNDEAYMAMLDAHEKDVSDMCQAMTTSAAAYKAQCDEQLAQLTSTMQAERASLMSQFQAELEVLYERRKKMELNRLDHKLQRERKEEKELDELRARDVEDYYALKVELESAISVFEQQLEDMRQMYALNGEKLEYNHAILLERDHDNKLTVDMYRNKMRKMKELVSQLAVKASEAERRVNEENRQVSVEYIKLTEAYKGLQKKYAHFIERDGAMYEDIRRMNEEQCMALARKLLHADKVITEQVLGREWRIWWKVRGEGEEEFDDEADINALTPQQIVDGIDAYDKRSSSTHSDDSSGGLQRTLIGKVRYSPAQVKAVLALLCSECHFLVPPPAPGTDPLGLTPADASLVYSSDAILAAIGCEDEEDIDELCGLFYSSPHDETINIDRNDVAGVVKEFVLHRQASGGGGGGGGGVGGGQGSGESGGGVAGSSAHSEKRARRAEKERRYWECLSRVVSEESREVWKALELWLVRYKAVLTDRQVALRETGELSRQNEELRALLQSYTTAKINDELQIPPTIALRRMPLNKR